MSKDDPVKSVEEMREAVHRFAKDHAAKEKAQSVESEAVAEVEEAVGVVTEPVVDEAGEPDEHMTDAIRRAEAVLFASADPLDATTLAKALPLGVEPGDVLLELQKRYKSRGVQLVEIAGKWRFQTAADLSFLFEETREQPRPLSRAAQETLAIIAYCQPVTRAEIEDVRGVAVSSGTIDILMEAGWVKPRGRRKTPGRPVTYGTTQDFMVHFGLESLDSLPGKEELKASGLLSAAIPKDFEIAGVPRDPETGEILEEEPMEGPEFQQDFFDGEERG